MCNRDRDVIAVFDAPDFLAEARTLHVPYQCQ